MSCFRNLSFVVQLKPIVSKTEKKNKKKQPKHRLALVFSQVFQIEPHIVRFASFREHGID